MALAAFELHDAAVALARDGRVIARSPGFAVLDGDIVTIGEDALRQAKLKPRMVSTRFWERLSDEPVMPAVNAGWTCADLVRTHIARIWDAAGAGVDRLVLVVPGHFDRRQLGLLLGISEQLALPVSGMVESALAACGTHPGADLVVHVAVHLHRTVITGIEIDGSAHRVFTDSIEGHGLVRLYERWVELIADVFVRTTRFDPLHNADSEQAIFERLPDWLAALAARDSLRIETVARDGHTHAIRLTRSQVEDRAREFCDALRGVVAARCASRRFVLELEENAANIPGLADSLLAGTAGPSVRLPPGAGALGALRRARWILQPDWRNTLTVSLPRDAFATPETVEQSR
jgi:hypothetical protein